MILSLAFECLLLERLADRRMGGHEDSALRVLAAVQEGAFGAGQLAPVIPLGGLLTEYRRCRPCPGRTNRLSAPPAYR